MNWTQLTTITVEALQGACGTTTTTAVFVIGFFAWFGLMMNFDRGVIVTGAIVLFAAFASIGYISLSGMAFVLLLVAVVFAIQILRMMGD